MKTYITCASFYDESEEFAVHFRGPKEEPANMVEYFGEQGRILARTLAWLTTSAWQEGFIEEFERAVSDPALNTAETLEEFVGAIPESYDADVPVAVGRETSLTPA